MADLGPGTMPCGKYPESPAPAGSHALISRTPTPGGMLHANLGLPRPPPRNFQPPLPQQLPVQPQKNPPNQKPPRLPRRRAGCRHSVAACVSDHSLACERIPLRHRSNLQRKKQHRHSGIFRVADLGPGTMPRGKYPESPAPAGSHALISRTPTPGGMLHANLGPPRPPPRNFQPPLPRFPSRLSPRRMSGTTVGRILSHPLPRRHAWLAGPPANTYSRNKPSKQTTTTPPLKNKNPSCRHSVAACVSDHSRGQALAPAIALKTNGNNTQTIVIPESPPQGGASHRSCGYAVAKRLHGRGGAAWQSFSELRHSRNNPQNKRPHPPIVIPEFSAWLTSVLEQCRAENIRNLPRQRAPTPLFPERRPREACSMPISGCHDLPLATFNLPSRVFRHGYRRAECLERRWGGFFHTHSRGGCGCLAGPPANTCPRNKPSKQTATTPPLKTKNPSCRHSVAACVSDHSRGQALAPAIALKTNGNNTQTIVIPESPPQGGASHRSCGYAVAKRPHGRGGAAWQSFSELRHYVGAQKKMAARADVAAEG